MGNKLIFSRVSSIFLISLIFFSYFAVSVYAQDASVDSESVVNGESTGNYYCGDGQYYDFVNSECRSAESVGQVEQLGFVEGMFRGMRYLLSSDDAKAQLSAEISAEKVTELESALDAGDYEAVEAIANEFSQEMQRAGEVMQNYMGEVEISYEDYSREIIDPGFYIDRGSEWWELRERERAYQQIISDAEISRKRILGLVETGELTQEEADGIINAMSGPEKLARIIDSEKDKIIDGIVDDSGEEIKRWDIQYPMRAEDEAIGFTKLHYQNAVDSEDIARNRFTLEQLKQEITDSDELDFKDVAPLYMNARIQQQEARNDLADENYAEAFENYQTTNDLINSLEEYLLDGESALDNINPLDNDFEEITANIESENLEVVTAYESEGVRDRLAEQYPEYRAELDRTYTQAADMVMLEASIDLVYEATVEKYKYEGMAEDEAREKVAALKAEEEFYAKGGNYYPVGYVSLENSDESSQVDYEYGGGFAEGFSYTGPQGTTYQYGTTGYSWQSPLTKTGYQNNYPADYDPLRIEHGSETYTYTTGTEEGNYEYDYYPTGYTITNPDGTTQEISYGDTSATAQFVGGTEVRYGLYGYDCIYNGEATRYIENPVYGNYMDQTTGYTYAPGVMHHEDPIYNTVEGVYEYSLGGVDVDFNPIANSFELDETTIITPPVPVAPVGLEDELVNGEIVTSHGEVLTYDSTQGIWTSEIVDEETQETVVTEFVVAPNQIYLHDDDDNIYIDPSGNIVETAELAGTSWQETPGGSWLSETGVIYDPITGNVGGVSDSSTESRVYGAEYNLEGSEVNRYTYRTDGRFVFNPALGTRGDYEFVPATGIPGYDPFNPPTRDQTLPDGTTVTWTADSYGRYYTSSSAGQTYYGYENYRRNEQVAEIGRTVVGDDGQTYTVTSDRGWTNSEGIAVSPPNVGGVQQPSSASRYGIYSDSGSRDRNYNYVYTNPDTGEQTAVWLPPGVAPDSANSETVSAQIQQYGVANARGYDPASGASFGYSSSTYTGVGDYGRGYGYYGSSGSSQSYSSGFGHVKQPDGTWIQVETASEAAALAGNPDYSPPSGYAGSYASRYQPNVRTDENGVEFQTEVTSGRIYQRGTDGQWTATDRYDTAQVPSSGGYGYSNPYSGYAGSAGYAGPTSSGSGSSFGSYSPGNAGYDSSGVFRDAGGNPATVPSNFGANIGSGQPWAPGTPGYTPGYVSPGAGSYGYGCANGACGGGYAPSNNWAMQPSGGMTSGSQYGYGAYSGPYMGGGGFNENGQYVGGDYGNYRADGTWSGGATQSSEADYYAQYPGGTYVPDGGSYSGTTTGSGYTGGSYTGGSYTGGSTSGDSGGSTSGSTSGGDSGGSTSGGDSGGSTSGGDSGGSTGGGAVIAGEDAKIDNALIRFFKRLFGRN